MAIAMHLYIPEEEHDKDVIENYFDYLVEKHQEVDPGDHDVSRHNGMREYHLEKYRETGWVSIYHRGWPDYPATEAWEEFWDILESEGEENHQTKPITDEETLRTLVELLKDMKEELKERGGGPERSDGLEYTPEDREFGFELGPIALIEFAIDEGYGIWMDY